MPSYRDFIAQPDRAPVIVAHRGAWHQAPENSAAAVAAAVDAGYDVVEIDVRKSRDGELFLMHDPTLKRMVGRDEAPENFTMAELTGMRLRPADGRGNASATDQPIPTLAEALDAGKGGIFFDLDVKDLNLVAETASVAAKVGMADQVAVKRPIASVEAAVALRDLGAAHGVMIMPLMKFTAGGRPQELAILGATECVMVESRFDRLQTLVDLKDEFRARGVSTWINTLDAESSCGLPDDLALRDPDAVWGVLAAAGASVFQTDEPEALAAYVAATRAVAE